MARVPLFHDSLSRCLLSPATALQRDTMGNLRGGAHYGCHDARQRSVGHSARLFLDPAAS